MAKAPTGIYGFDELTGGGLPRGRSSLVCGGPGCGKTLFGLEFLARGAIDFNEPGVLISFEEPEADMIINAQSLGFDLRQLATSGRLAIEFVHLERTEIEETGDYDLEALFLRLDQALKSVGGKRIVLDTIEALFAGLTNMMVLRAELRRLFTWLKRRGVTAVITAERGEATLTRQGLEEYVSDCVILLDHRVTEQISTRRLRVVKYRGSSHGTNEYPFLIDRDGIAVVPVTSLRLQHEASMERVSSGVGWLDEMFGGRGFYRGSSILLSGMAGSGKTSFAAHFVERACRRGERALCFVFEESPAQYIRNMSAIGIDLERWVRRKRLRIVAARPTLYGLEFHLASMHRAVSAFEPAVVVVDPLSSLSGGSVKEVDATLIRIIDYLKSKGVTSLFTHLLPGSAPALATDIGVSSLMDTWILLKNALAGEDGGRRVAIIKSRGMPHAQNSQQFVITDHGVASADGAGPDGVPAATAAALRQGRRR